MQLGFNLSLKDLNCTNKKFKNQVEFFKNLTITINNEIYKRE